MVPRNHGFKNDGRLRRALAQRGRMVKEKRAHLTVNPLALAVGGPHGRENLKETDRNSDEMALFPLAGPRHDAACRLRAGAARLRPRCGGAFRLFAPRLTGT